MSTANKKIFFSKEKIFIASLIAVFSLNAFLKTHQYLERGFLWYDEVKLALNILKLDYLQLFQALDHNQVAPPFFLVPTKFLISVFGNHENVFRFLPYVASILNPFLLYLVMRKRFGFFSQMIAIVLFCCAPLTVRFASEFKPYTFDISVALVVFIFLTNARDFYAKSRVSLNVVFFIFLPLFSIPIVFILGSFLFVEALTHRKNPQRLTYLIFLGLLMISTYFFYYKLGGHGPNMNSFWSQRVGHYKDALEPFLDKTRYNLEMILLYNLGFLKLWPLAVGFYFFGIFRLWSENKKFALLCFLPILFCFIASFFVIYPFRDRMVLFLYPVFFMSISAGLYFFFQRKNIVFLLLGILSTFLLLSYPVKASFKLYQQPYQKRNIEGVLKFMDRSLQNNDDVYLFYRSHYIWDYHWPRISQKYVNPVIGRREQGKNSDITQELNRVPKSERVWLVFLRCVFDKQKIYRDQLLKGLRESGSCKQMYKQDADSVFLCQFKDSKI
jgi:hypothetical protein